MKTVRYTFPIISRQQVVRCKCFMCRKRLARIVRVEHTVNPFNKNANGTPKTRHEVLLDVVTELKEKVAELQRLDTQTGTILCKPCKAYKDSQDNG